MEAAFDKKAFFTFEELSEVLDESGVSNILYTQNSQTTCVLLSLVIIIFDFTILAFGIWFQKSERYVGGALRNIFQRVTRQRHYGQYAWYHAIGFKIPRIILPILLGY